MKDRLCNDKVIVTMPEESRRCGKAQRYPDGWFRDWVEDDAKEGEESRWNCR
jgi:hypothetical protein